MKKSIKLNLILAVSITSLNAATFINPLGNAFKSTDNGGTLSAIDAYKDGIGAEVVDNLMTTDNTAMNTLVYTYGDAAKTSGVSVSNKVLATPTATPKEIVLANQLSII